MSGSHSDLGPELRALAAALLDRIDPAVRAAAALAAARSGDSPGRCQQVWCPVCALAAVAAGEEHPLLTVIAEHSMALLTVVRAVIDGHDAAAPAGPPQPPTDPSGPPPQTADDAGPAAEPRPAAEPGGPGGAGRYQPIHVTVED